MSDAAAVRDLDCVFCRIVADEIPSDRLYEDDRLIVFRDLNPQAPLHALVVPRTHLRDVRELAEDAPLMAHVAATAGTIASTHANGEFRLVFNTGSSAGQTVFHVHGHVLAGGTLAEGEL